MPLNKETKAKPNPCIYHLHVSHVERRDIYILDGGFIVFLFNDISTFVG